MQKGLIGKKIGMTQLFDENGNVDINKVKPIMFDPFNNTYAVIEKTVGKAFSEGKKLK